MVLQRSMAIEVILGWEQAIATSKTTQRVDDVIVPLDHVMEL